MRKAAASACGVLLVLGAAASVAWLASARDPVPAAISAAGDRPPTRRRRPDCPPAPRRLSAARPRSEHPAAAAAGDPVAARRPRCGRRSRPRTTGPSPTACSSEPTVERILATLDDPYTEYLSPLRYQELRDGLAQAYFGVGLTVGPGDGGLIVTSSLEGPAREAGIRPGDLIIKIDGRPAAKLPFERSAALIMGEKGTVVELTVHRSGERRPMRFTVVRQEVAFPAVRHAHGEAGRPPRRLRPRALVPGGRGTAGGGRGGAAREARRRGADPRSTRRPGRPALPGGRGGLRVPGRGEGRSRPSARTGCGRTM